MIMCTLEIGAIAATKNVCVKPQGVMDQETAFLNALARVAVIRRNGDHLELRSGDGALMVTAVRTPEPPGQP